MFLSEKDLQYLTGYSLAAYQIRWLTRNGYPFEVTASRKPRVLLAFVEKRFGGGPHGIPAKNNKRQEPDFSHWK